MKTVSTRLAAGVVVAAALCLDVAPATARDRACDYDVYVLWNIDFYCTYPGDDDKFCHAWVNVPRAALSPTCI